MRFRLGKKIGLSKPADLLALIASWLLFSSFFKSSQASPGVFVLWILLTSVFSMLLLGAIGYFEHHIPKPDFTDLMSLLFALPSSAFLAKWMLMLTSHVPPVHYKEALYASVGVAVVFEIGQMIIFKIHRAMGRKWSLLTHLDPKEFEALRTQIDSTGNSWWIQLREIDNNGGRPRGDEVIVISRKAARHLHDQPDLLTAHLRGQEIVDVRQLLKEFRGRLDLHNTDAWTFLFGSTFQSFPIRFYFHLKEFLEVFLAAALLVALSPLLIVLALGVLVTSGRPILYRQVRLGYRGKKFRLYKFRTMDVTAEDDGPQWAQEDDPRLTAFGRWLRRTRLDELPQLINVIRGELSFVGPRPERPEFYALLSEKIPLFSMRLLVRPGVTGWAQVRQGYAGTIEECKTKLEYDLYYVQHMTPRLDLRVMVNTAALMIRGNGGR